MMRETIERPARSRRVLLSDAVASSPPLAVVSVATQSVAKPPAPEGMLWAAVVHSGDQVRFAASRLSRVELMRRLAAYIRRRSPHTLWPSDARHVRGLLVRGELEAAVEVYFGRVGQRWDPEWLVTTAATTAAGLADADRPDAAGSDRQHRSVREW